MFGPLRSADFPRYPYHFLPCPASALPREEHGGESAWGGGSNPAERTSKKSSWPRAVPCYLVGRVHTGSNPTS